MCDEIDRTLGGGGNNVGKGQQFHIMKKHVKKYLDTSNEVTSVVPDDVFYLTKGSKGLSQQTSEEISTVYEN